MAVIAIIPARGGSKRIPRKNIKPFLGQPMIAYTVAAAHNSGVFDRILVSTDDEEVASIAQSHGAEAPFRRPEALANDFAGTTPVIAHAISWLVENGTCVRAACCLYPTAPFLRPESIVAGLETLRSGVWDFVFSATTFPYPIFRAFTLRPEGGLSMVQPEHFHTRSQDLPEAWHDAAQFYWGRPEAWQEGRPIFGERSTIVKLPRWQVQDIDTAEDWIMAERLFQIVRKEGHDA